VAVSMLCALVMLVMLPGKVPTSHLCAGTPLWSMRSRRFADAHILTCKNGFGLAGVLPQTYRQAAV
jgi:hypothetical protein